MQLPSPRLVTLLGLFLLMILGPGTGLAQKPDLYTVGLMAGLGGSNENDPNTDLKNFSFQALFTMKIDSGTVWGVRVGRLDLDTEIDALDSELSYLTVAGEYLYHDRGFESGLYLGLGFYDYAGGPALEDETSIGLAVGVTGELDLNDRFSVLFELSGHYAGLDRSQFLLMGHVGVGYHF